MHRPDTPESELGTQLFTDKPYQLHPPRGRERPSTKSAKSVLRISSAFFFGFTDDRFQDDDNNASRLAEAIAVDQQGGVLVGGLAFDDDGTDFAACKLDSSGNVTWRWQVSREVLSLPQGELCSWSFVWFSERRCCGLPPQYT